MSVRINNEKMLELFLTKGKQHSVRDVARLLSISPPSASKYLEQYHKEGLLIREEFKNNLLYSPNTDSRIFKLKKRSYNTLLLVQSGLVAHLEETLSYPTIILFGSYAKGENHEESDIDLFIIADEKQDLKLERYEKTLGAEIQVFLHTPKEFKQLQKSSPELINNVLNGVIISGYVKVFA